MDAAKVGRATTVIVEASLIDERMERINEVKGRFLSCPQIQQMYYVTREFDFLLIFNVKDMNEYNDIITDTVF